MKLYRKVPLFIRVLPVYLIITAAFTYPLFAKQPQNIASKEKVYSASAFSEDDSKITPQRIQGSPRKIVIQSLGIETEVVDGSYDQSTNMWSITDNTANYAINTALPNNERDKSFIYGHWSDDVFGPTKKLKAGDRADLFTDNGHRLTYAFTHKINIKPTDVEIMNTFIGKPGIVLMTCDGPFAEERRIMYFELVEYV